MIDEICVDRRMGWFFGCLILNIILIAGLCMMCDACSGERQIYVSSVYDDY